MAKIQLSDADAELFKTWVIPKLENISDADSDVVADYVLALVTTDQTEAAAKASCVENLQDFLLDNTQRFVDEIFAALDSRIYDPRRRRPQLPPSTSTALKPTNLNPSRQLNDSRKRSYNDLDAESNQDGRGRRQDAGGGPMKQTKRPRLPQSRYTAGLQYDHQATLQPMSSMAPVIPGRPNVDFSNPMATLMAMQEFLGSMMPGMIGASMQGSGQVSPERCRDYDKKGFCTRGISCPYDHGNNPFVVPQVNDGHNSTLSGRGRSSAKGRGRGGNYRGGGKRSEFSQGGRNHRSTTAIVVEQIPQEMCDEQSVRETFSDFGPVEAVTMHSDSKLAIVKYHDHESAQAAYNSPRAFFDNRFVKVYYQKSDEDRKSSHRRSSHQSKSTDLVMDEAEAEAEINLEELAKQQEGAQRKYEEAKKEREETERKRLEIGNRLRTVEQERLRIASILSKKTGIPIAGANVDDETEETKALKAQLAQLQAEAESLGIDPEVGSSGNSNYMSYRGRGGFRGRFRGRGGYASPRGGAVKRLDNRPKAVCLQFQDRQYDAHEESLRQYLLFRSTESSSLAKHPTREDAAVVSFNERYQAENFLVAVAGGQIPDMSGVELSWYNSNSTTADGSREGDDQMESVERQPAAHEDPNPSRDMDTYELSDDDRWE